MRNAGEQSLILTYKTDITEAISLEIPSGIKVSSKHGSLKNGVLSIKPANNKNFTIVVNK